MKLDKKSIRLTAAMIGCFALLAVCARVTDNALPTAVETAEKPVIVLDAGHGGYVLNMVV